VTVENALYADPRILEAAAVGVPDERLGELVTAIVSVRPEYEGQVTEAILIEQARSRYVCLDSSLSSSKQR
jgi:acyl-CoA synthetase (AMP-forming)/AMP-acid ligase II